MFNNKEYFMKLTLILFYFLCATSIFAQNTEDSQTPQPDQRLYEVYDPSYVDQLLTENPFLIKRWNYYLDNAYYLIDAVPGKTEDNPTITIPDMENINILLLEKQQGLTHDHQLPVIYNIKNSNKCLVYVPGKKFAKDFRASLDK